VTDVSTAVPVTVRFFAAASAAAGSDSTVLALKRGATVDDAITELCGQSDRLELVLQRCSFLCDGMAVRDRSAVLHPHQTLDVLPPFSGG
jgi:molybdopterin synthase sulfur carrier subunit